jgi:MarR family 2-MHQ and catechol resistance regulon transcriptional repressor
MKWDKPGPRYGALIQLLRTSETVWNASRLLFVRWDLSPSQFNILNLLHLQPDGLSQVELSRQLLMHRSNVTGLVDRLEQRGLLVRREVPDDRRAYRVALTPAGSALVQEVLPHYYRAAEALWEGIPVRRAEELMAHLAQVCANVERTAKRLQEEPHGKPNPNQH